MVTSFEIGRLYPKQLQLGGRGVIPVERQFPKSSRRLQDSVFCETGLRFNHVDPKSGHAGPKFAGSVE
jgi:hypothetical protein